MTLQFEQPVGDDSLREAFTQLGHNEALLQHATGTNQFVIRTRALTQTIETSADGTTTPSERTQI